MQLVRSNYYDSTPNCCSLVHHQWMHPSYRLFWWLVQCYGGQFWGHEGGTIVWFFSGSILSIWIVDEAHHLEDSKWWQQQEPQQIKDFHQLLLNGTQSKKFTQRAEVNSWRGSDKLTSRTLETTWQKTVLAKMTMTTRQRWQQGFSLLMQASLLVTIVNEDLVPCNLPVPHILLERMEMARVIIAHIPPFQ